MFEHPDRFAAKRYIFCNTCRTETNHICMGQHHRKYYDDHGDVVQFIYITYSRLWICAGCEDGTLEKLWANDLLENQPQYLEISYSHERSQLHVERKNFKKIPDKLNTVYKESLIAFNNNIKILCSIGIRSLIEGICSDRGITGGNLEKKSII